MADPLSPIRVSGVRKTYGSTVAVDEVSFEVLVRRHGEMVMGVCRRVLRNHHDAEDAFQATFLVLARRAGSIAARASLASWLYAVAFNAALRAKAAIGKRREGAKKVADMPEPEAPALVHGQGREAVEKSKSRHGRCHRSRFEEFAPIR